MVTSWFLLAFFTSSKLEGAHTTREVAKKMIQEARKPRDRGERMILNEAARSDLLDLVARGLMRKRKRGRRWVFAPEPNLERKLRGADSVWRTAFTARSRSARAVPWLILQIAEAETRGSGRDWDGN
jgi:hypothetical protein